MKAVRLLTRHALLKFRSHIRVMPVSAPVSLLLAGLGSGVSPGEHGGSCSVLLQQESSAHHIQPVSIAAHAFAYQEGILHTLCSGLRLCVLAVTCGLYLTKPRTHAEAKSYCTTFDCICNAGGTNESLSNCSAM